MLMIFQCVSFGNSFFDEDTLPIFQTIGRKDGLKDLSVSGIVQDRNGYIWFATQGGLYKYNGVDTVPYRNNPFDSSGLAHNLIQTMYYAEDTHVLWLGTYQGISKLDIKTNTFTNFSVSKNDLSNSVVTAILKDTNGELWFGTMDGLNWLDTRTNKFTTYDVGGDVIRSILQDSKGRLLVGTYEGMWLFNQDKKQLELVDISLPSPYVMSVREHRLGIITLGLWDGGVIELDLGFNILNEFSYEDDRIYTTIMTKDGILWAGSWGGGLFAMDKDTIHRFNGDNSNGDISHSIVYSLFEDDSGILWIGTNGGGVDKANPRRANYLEFYHDQDDSMSLDSGKINAIYKDSKERLWIAVYNKGINRFDEQMKQLIKYNSDNVGAQQLDNNQVIDFLELNNKLYIATGDGISIYDEATDNFINTDILPDDTIAYALEVDHDDDYWVGTYSDGVYHFDKEWTLLKHYSANDEDQLVMDNLIYDIHTDRQGDVWIATNNGLSRYHKESKMVTTYLKEESNYSGLPSSNIRRLFEDSKGQMWIGTSGGGVAKFIEAENKFISFTESDGLYDNSVISINESEEGKIWVATHGGISLIDMETETITNLITTDDQQYENYTGGGWTDTDGSIYLGGINGVMHFYPNKSVENDVEPHLYIKDMSLYNTSIDANIEIFNGKYYELASTENYMSFDFEALDYENKGMVQYYYQLVGVDSEWVSSNNRQFASYSNLDSGYYEFKVKAKTVNGLVTEAQIVSFFIKVPWYKTIYAYLFYILIGMFIIYLVVKIRESHLIAQRNSELAKLNQKLEVAVIELENVSIKDPLTGIYNRRYFDTVLEDHLELAKRGSNYLSLLMLDIDDFKKINDKYGHIAGDEFLINFTEILSKQLLRNTDFVARYGGDEFAIVLYDTDTSGTHILADRLLNEIRRDKAFKAYEVSVSIGVYTVIPNKDMTTSGFIEKADKALYEAKSSGKNRVIFGK